MRVIHVITRLVVGGAQENTIATVLGLREKSGIQVSLISGPTAGAEGSLESAFQNLPELFTVLPELVRPVHPLKDFLALRQLEKIFREQKPGIVHTHSGKAGILGRLAAKRAGVPVVIHTIHGPSFGNFQDAASNLIFRAAEKRAARTTTHFIVVADAMKTQYLAAGIGRPGQYTQIFSGFPLEPFLAAKNDLELRNKLGIAPDDFVVGKIARLFKLKGHDDLFAVAPELVRRNPKIRFLLVGDGEWRRSLTSRRKKLVCERHFVFTGLVPPSEVPKYVGIMDGSSICHCAKACRARCRRRLPLANRSSPTTATAQRKFVLKTKPGFWFHPAIILTWRLNCPDCREKNRCVNAWESAVSNLCGIISPSKKWLIPSTICI